MHLFVSLVGQQPGAVAWPLWTWAGHSKTARPTHVLLLATRQTLDLAKRLESWAATSLSIPVEIQQVSGSLTQDQGAAAAPEAVASWIRDHRPESVVFNAGPGLKTLVVMIARSLPPEATLLHPLDDRLYVVQRAAGREVRTSLGPRLIGLEALLELAGVEYRTGVAIPDVVSGALARAGLENRTDLVRGLTVKGRTRSLQLALAYEQAGFLHGLVYVGGRDRLKRQREGRHLQNVPQEFPHLSVRLTVLSPSESIRRRAAAEGMGTINAESDRLAEEIRSWAARRARSPILPQQVEGPAAASLVLSSAQGRGGEGPDLVTFLGPDPSATLISLCTHRPRRTWIALDQGSAVVLEKARLLQENARSLPVGSVTFVPTDILGTGLEGALTAVGGLTQPTRVDITPGTKAQGCALGRLPGVELWSLRGHRGDAASISHPENPPIPLEGPDVLTQARLRGGTVQVGPGQEEIRAQGKFYALLAQFLLRYAVEHPEEAVTLRNMRCRDGEVSLNVRVRLDDREATGAIPVGSGLWWERVVAHAFLAAGADEVFCGVRWEWAEESSIRDEVDVVARFGHRFVAVSCKSGERHPVRRTIAEIEAVAYSCLGRFAVPLVVCPILEDERSEQLEGGQGAVVLGLRHVADADLLGKTLQKLFELRTTLRD